MKDKLLPWELKLRNMTRLEVLNATEGGFTREWFEDMDEDRSKATHELLALDLIERVEDYRRTEPHPFKLTRDGAAFLASARSLIPSPCGIDWKRVDEIEFPEPTAVLLFRKRG